MDKIKLFIVLVGMVIQSCGPQNAKINGVSFVASREPINETHINPVTNIKANYASIMPFGFIKELTHPNIVYNTKRQWFGETEAGAKQYIESLKKRHIKIMLKPQLWVWRGEFTGGIKMNSEENWKLLEISYSKFILDYARLAEDVHADIFCIGTELEGFIDNRPEYWRQLIAKIRTIYKGKLTYASNWNEYSRTPFWQDLDFIGIDAYFPVSTSKTPTIIECLNSWKLYTQTIKNTSEKYKKPILFTEYGYRSVDFSGKEPWKSDRDMTVVNIDAQNNTTEALFETFWHQEWFAGGFVWKWFHDYTKSGGEMDTRFTPQNKPAEAIIKRWYSSN
jgi:hypothetical protein